MYPSSPSSHFQYLLTHTHPAALAWIQGSASNPRLAGSVKFYQTTYGGVLIEAEIFGLPNIDTQDPPTFTVCIFTSTETAPGPLIKPAVTTILETCPIRSIPEICRPCWATKVMHILYFMTNVSLSKTLLGGPLSYTAWQMTLPASLRVIPAVKSGAESFSLW